MLRRESFGRRCETGRKYYYLVGMIQRTELRIGNKVKQAGFVLTIVEIGSFDALCANDQRASNCKYENLEGIELTPEILVQSGFLKQIDTQRLSESFHLDGLILIQMRRGYILKGFKLKLNHVHQLQNLYHSLTGTELPVNIKEKA